MAAKPPRRLGGLGPAVLGLSLAVLLLAGQQIDYLSLTAAPLPTATATPVASSPAVPTPNPTATDTPAATAVARQTATPLATPTPRVYGEPTRLRIPRLGIDGPVVKVGLAADGQLQAPRQANQVGWYAEGVRPGHVGNALLDGHLDWLRSTAVFWQLGKAEAGDEVIVETAAGEQVRFIVEWKALYEAKKAPMDLIFGATTVPAVTLITCGGQFDKTSQSYTHRWVVRALAK